MICPKCTFEQPNESTQCLSCGVIFEKLHSAQSRLDVDHEDVPSEEFFIGAPNKESQLQLAGRVIVWALLLIWGVTFIFTPVSGEAFFASFMHLVNLPFHEAGHVIFSPFGRFIQVLGGTLGQWLIPLIVTISFVVKADRFAASVGLWWLGQSFMDCAPYMDDARAGQLMLIGGVTGSEVEDYHDWEIILTRLGLMQYDHVIARISFGCGIILMITALVWGGWELSRQYQVRRHL